jgi:hypothetical protein
MFEDTLVKQGKPVPKMSPDQESGESEVTGLGEPSRDALLEKKRLGPEVSPCKATGLGACPDQEIGGSEVKDIDEGTSRDTIVKQEVLFLDIPPAKDSGEGKIADFSAASQSTPTEQRLRFRNVIIQRHGSRDVLRERERGK